MKRLFAVAAVFASLGLLLGFYLRGGSPTALAVGGGGGVPAYSLINGDVNADGEVDLSDGVTILSFLFLGAPTALVPLCETQGSSGLPDTGQTKCYDEAGIELDRRECGSGRCSGQDGSYSTGCPAAGRFVDNRDGTVTDHCTGLMWQKDTADVNGDGHSEGDDALLWCDSLAFCKNLSFAGHDDWRLPNIRELQSIVDYGRGRGGQAIDPVFGAFTFYWSSTSSDGSPETAWTVGFDYGPVEGFYKDVTIYVRAVRNAP